MWEGPDWAPVGVAGTWQGQDTRSSVTYRLTEQQVDRPFITRDGDT